MMDKTNPCPARGSLKVNCKLNPHMIGLLECVCQDCGGDSWRVLIVNRDEIVTESDLRKRGK
jgi:hypothetical protein